MSTAGDDAARLPAELGQVLRTSEGSAPFRCDVIAAGPGHPSESEQVILDVLKARHAAQPYDWVFTGYDASQKQGEFALEGKELVIDPYRNFPDADITAGIVENFIRTGMAASAWGFAVVSQPACRIVPVDDWYAWAGSRDALRQLDAAAGRLSVAVALLERPVRRADERGGSDPTRRLLDLLRLRWTGTEWLAGRDAVMALDIARVLVGRQPADVAAPLTRLLSELRLLAASFYDASVQRTKALVAGAVERMRQTHARRGVILVAVPWIEQAEAALEGEVVGCDIVLPAKVAMGPMLDDARLLLGQVDEQNRRLGELFTGKRIRTRIEALLEDRPDLAKARAQDWAGAAQGLATRYEMRFDTNDLKSAEECVSRALALDDAMDNAWWVKGELLTLQRKGEEALGALDRALSLKPRSGDYWRAKATVLDSLGRTRNARTHFVRAIQLEPRKGSLWTFLGLHYHRHDRRRAACYCFGKAKEYRDEPGRENHGTLGCPEPRAWHCPLPLLPIVIRAMNRIVLPLWHGWDDTRWTAALMAGLIFLLGAATWGAIAGALAGGIWGGLSGFLTFLLAAAVAVVCLFLFSAASSGAGLGRGATAVAIILGAWGAWCGIELGGRVGSGAWQPIWSGASRIALGAIGAAMGLFATIIVLQWWKRRR